MKLKYITVALATIAFSCNQKDNDPTEEDYSALFPWKGIEKPESGYEDLNIRQCDPNLALSNYQYIGVELENKRTYKVTLKCSFTEAPSLFGGTSSYEIRFIGADKKLKVISSANNPEAFHRLVSGQEYTTSFEAVSGFPIYLSVNGRGNRFSNVKAKLEAVSTDGLFSIPILSTEQYQNEEGVVQIRNPYCEYVILP